MISFPDFWADLPYGVIALLLGAFVLGQIFTDLLDRYSWIRQNYFTSRNPLHVGFEGWGEFRSKNEGDGDGHLWSSVKMGLRNSSSRKLIRDINVRIFIRYFSSTYIYVPTYIDRGPISVVDIPVLNPLQDHQFAILSAGKDVDKVVVGNWKENAGRDDCVISASTGVIHMDVLVTSSNAPAFRQKLTFYISGAKPALMLHTNHGIRSQDELLPDPWKGYWQRCQNAR